MRVLLIEDNQRLAELIGKGLRDTGFAVDSFHSIADAEAVLGVVQYDCMILDRGLPDGDGLDLLCDLRRRGDAMPILVLTARDGVEDRVAGLNAGADDYLLKPFVMDELLARLRALLRRPGASLGVVLSCGNVRLDTVTREVGIAGTAIPMPKRETDMLEHLLRRAGRVVSKRTLEEGLYGFDDDVSSNTVEVLMSRLRKKLGAEGSGVVIHTLRGIGYMLAGSDTIP
ncbi:MAG: response regulator [Magnetospirillum sp.]